MMEFLKELRRRYLKKRKDRDPNFPVTTWMGDDILSNGKIGKCITVILNTPGCRWAYEYGGCTMCGYLMDGSPGEITAENIINQFNYAIEKYYKEIENDPKNICIKIFTSGSFLDEREVPKEARRYILSKIGELDIKEVVIESRIEYIREDTLEEVKECLGSVNMEIGVGVETFNEEIRKHSINKGVCNRDILDTLELAKEYSIGLKAYLLIKPLFITERDAIEDGIYSGNKCLELGFSRISYCPATVHKGTLMEILWKKGQYRPPFLWSVLEIIYEVKRKNPDTIVICDTSGIPSNRGAHNLLKCKCNEYIKRILENFTLRQDLSDIKRVLEMDCCKDHWERFLEFEERNIVPLGDINIKYSNKNKQKFLN